MANCQVLTAFAMSGQESDSPASVWRSKHLNESKARRMLLAAKATSQRVSNSPVFKALTVWIGLVFLVKPELPEPGLWFL